MNAPEMLRAKAQSVLGTDEPVLAAGIFGLQDGYRAITAGGLAGSSIGSAAVGGIAGGVVGNVAGMHAARELRAEAQGVTVRMLVAVTEQHIHILDWATGSGPSEVLRSFDRAGTDVEIKKFGLSRRITLHSSADGHMLALTGTTAAFSAEAKGDKAVLSALG